MSLGLRNTLDTVFCVTAPKKGALAWDGKSVTLKQNVELKSRFSRVHGWIRRLADVAGKAEAGLILPPSVCYYGNIWWMLEIKTDRIASLDGAINISEKPPLFVSTRLGYVLAFYCNWKFNRIGGISGGSDSRVSPHKSFGNPNS